MAENAVNFVQPTAQFLGRVPYFAVKNLLKFLEGVLCVLWRDKPGPTESTAGMWHTSLKPRCYFLFFDGQLCLPGSRRLDSFVQWGLKLGIKNCYHLNIFFCLLLNVQCSFVNFFYSRVWWWPVLESAWEDKSNLSVMSLVGCGYNFQGFCFWNTFFFFVGKHRFAVLNIWVRSRED